MNAKPVLMIEIADRDWTLKAMHDVGELARKTSATVALVKMIPVQHIAWLGTECGNLNLTEAEMEALLEFEATLQDYGVEHTTLLFQYASRVEATAEAADLVNAQVVFARVLDSHVPFSAAFQRRSLARKLAQHGRELRPLPDPQAGAPVPGGKVAAARVTHR
jgi:hypothetical protein